MDFLPPQYRQPIKYIISGGTSAVTNLLALFALTDFFHIWYLYSTPIAYMCGYVVSFTLHKFWTFESMDRAKAKKELPLHLSLALGNLAVNIALMYIFVDILGVWYISAQILATGLIAIEGFYLTRKIFQTNT